MHINYHHVNCCRIAEVRNVLINSVSPLQTSTRSTTPQSLPLHRLTAVSVLTFSPIYSIIVCPKIEWLIRDLSHESAFRRGGTPTLRVPPCEQCSGTSTSFQCDGRFTKKTGTTGDRQRSWFSFHSPTAELEPSSSRRRATTTTGMSSRKWIRLENTNRELCQPGIELGKGPSNEPLPTSFSTCDSEPHHDSGPVRLKWFSHDIEIVVGLIGR
ncbi:hypothetical protein SAMN05421809_3591 [Natronorubrum daqingense]|uniref:Uncharacterized protein n=1 Tax=Natronorubrum daqingense TaxID=588898 RepID=A0A1N7FYS2_9EURY|nr:hypothetical protein SAMN05421809_3591 [Natronorubrum daqingense]